MVLLFFHKVFFKTISPFTIIIIIHFYQRWCKFSVWTGNTVVMASVYGPLEAKIQKELSDRMYIELNFKPKTGMPGMKIQSKIMVQVIELVIIHASLLGVAERGKEKLIKTTCNQILLPHLHPRTAINITIQEMQDGGAVSYRRIRSNRIYTFPFWFRYYRRPSMLPAWPWSTRASLCSASSPLSRV